MEIGISTACFYPQPTEVALLKTAALHPSVAEIFFNSPSELLPPFAKALRKTADEYGLSVCAVHPFASFAESYNYFSNYPRRFEDAKEELLRYFEVMHTLGAKIFVMHGIKKPGTIADELYFERFAALTSLGRQNGVIVAQENVVHYRSESPEFLSRMAKYIGTDFKMVLDIKQARRANYDVYEFTERLEKHIAHIHISDFDDTRDCTLPLTGKFDFARFFSYLKDKGYDGSCMIELYADGFSRAEELQTARNRLLQYI